MSSEINFSFDPAADIRPLLSPRENLLWFGAPRKGLMLRRSDTFMIPFSLFWLGFVCFWEYMAFGTGFFVGMAAGGLFVLVGLYLVIGRFFVDAWRRSGTLYGITESRIIVISPSLFSKNNESTNLKTISDLSFAQKNDGSGTLKFGSQIQAPAFGGLRSSSINMGGKSFEMISHVKDVYDLVSRQMSRKEDS